MKTNSKTVTPKAEKIGKNIRDTVYEISSGRPRFSWGDLTVRSAQHYGFIEPKVGERANDRDPSEWQLTAKGAVVAAEESVKRNAKRIQRREYARERNQAMRDLGLVRVKGTNDWE